MRTIIRRRIFSPPSTRRLLLYGTTRLKIVFILLIALSVTVVETREIARYLMYVCDNMFASVPADIDGRPTSPG